MPQNPDGAEVDLDRVCELDPGAAARAQVAERRFVQPFDPKNPVFPQVERPGGVRGSSTFDEALMR